MSDCISPPMYPFPSVHKLGFHIHLKPPITSTGRVFKSKWSSIRLCSTHKHDSFPFISDDTEFSSLDFAPMEEQNHDFQLRSDREWMNQERGIHKNSSDDEESPESSSLGKLLSYKSQNSDSEFEELGRREVAVVKKGKGMARRSNFMAKQVICISSAISLGFVSQLWVDTVSWVVLFVEVRPSLLSTEFERFPLEDLAQVGDVILIQDKTVNENDFKLSGLKKLVGYTVVTPNGRSIGKVRGYTFNINSGTVESLELDSFGIPIIPSNWVSTYALSIDDVLEVLSDTIIVHEGALSCIQRLTKGLWDGQKFGSFINELDEEPGVNRQRRRRHKNVSNRRRRPKVQKRKSNGDDWELPMDFF